MIGQSIEKLAFLGEKARNLPFMERVDATAHKLNIALNPIDKTGEKLIEGNTSRIVSGLAAEGEWRCDTVRSLIETSRDTEKIANREVAIQRLDVLSSATYIAMRHGGNDRLINALGSKDGAAIDAVLPNSLKGIGGRVVEISINKEITNPKLCDALKKIDRRVEILRASGTVGEEQLGKLIGDKILELSELVDELDSKGYEELTRVSAYLGAEADRVKMSLAEREEVSHPSRLKKNKDVESRRFDDEIEPGDLSDEELLTDLLDDSDDEEKERILSGTKSERKALAAARRMQRMRNRFKEEEALEGETSLAIIRQKLDEIDASDKESGDIGLNTDKLRFLFGVTVGIDNKVLRITDLPPGVTPESVSSEIVNRMILNDLFLMASNTKDIEGVVKLMVGMHRGDSSHTMDKNMIGFFLNKGSNGIPVDLAWDLRQDAYFNYDEILGRIVRERPDLVQKAGQMRDSNSFTDTGVVMHKSELYGIDKDYGTNLKCDLEPARVEAVEQYMIDRIVAERHVTLKIAKKAVELARKLSIATFQDSAANIAFVDGDDYAELILFKWLRYQDGVEVTPGKASEAKNKPVGSIDTIKYIDSLTAPWLATVARKGTDRGMWKPLKAADIDAEAIGGKSDSAYHFASIIFKKVQPTKELFLKDLGPKELMSMYDMQKAFERLNKTIAEAIKSGYTVLNEKYIDADIFRKLGSTDKKALTDLQRKFRVVFMRNVLERGSLSPVGLGWNEEALEEIKLQYVTGNHFTTSTGNPDGNFINLDEWNKAIKYSGIIPRIRAAENRKNRRGMAGRLLGGK